MLPVANGVPPLGSAHHLGVLPLQFAPNVTVPGPHLSPGVTVGVGFAFTVNTTSSVAVPHGGVAVLVVVKRSVTVPIPVTLTVDVKEVGVLIVALAVPVCPTCVQAWVPFDPVPANVNEVGTEGAVWHFATLGPALFNGELFSFIVAGPEEVLQEVAM